MQPPTTKEWVLLNRSGVDTAKAGGKPFGARKSGLESLSESPWAMVSPCFTEVIIGRLSSACVSLNRPPHIYARSTVDQSSQWYCERADTV